MNPEADVVPASIPMVAFSFRAEQTRALECLMSVPIRCCDSGPLWCPSTTAAIFLLKKRRPHIYGDQPKTLTQNLSVRLMSPQQRGGGSKAERIAALGLPIPDEYVMIDVPDDEPQDPEEP